MRMHNKVEDHETAENPPDIKKEKEKEDEDMESLLTLAELCSSRAKDTRAEKRVQALGEAIRIYTKWFISSWCGLALPTLHQVDPSNLRPSPSQYHLSPSPFTNQPLYVLGRSQSGLLSLHLAQTDRDRK